MVLCGECDVWWCLGGVGDMCVRVVLWCDEW